MNIPSLFSTKERLKILTAVVFSDDPIKVSELARTLNVNKGLVSRYLRLLADAGVIAKNNGAFLVQSSSPSTKSLRIFLNLSRLDLGSLKNNSAVQAAGLYGSGSKGENTQSSDLDVWIVSKITDHSQQAVLSRKLRGSIPEIKLLFLTRDKILKIKHEDPAFYQALLYGSMLLVGDLNALHV